MDGVDGCPHVRVVQGVLHPIAVPCVSIQSCGVKRRDGRLAGGYGKHGRVEGELDLFWRWRDNKRVRENVLSRVVRGRGGGAMDLVHVCDDPREVGRGSDFVVEEGILVEEGRARDRWRLI